MAREIKKVFDFLDKKFPDYVTREELETQEFDNDTVQSCRATGLLDAYHDNAGGKSTWRFRLNSSGYQFLLQLRTQEEIKLMSAHTKEMKEIIVDFKEESSKASRITTKMIWITIAIGAIAAVSALIQVLPIIHPWWSTLISGGKALWSQIVSWFL